MYFYRPVLFRHFDWNKFKTIDIRQIRVIWSFWSPTAMFEDFLNFMKNWKKNVKFQHFWAQNKPILLKKVLVIKLKEKMMKLIL